MRRALAVLGATLTTLVGSLALAPAASAADYGCAGSVIDKYPIYGVLPINNKVEFGHVYLYYNSGTGKNCAVTVATNVGGYGYSKPMYIRIDRCRETSYTGSCGVVDSSIDSDDYQYYAGPRSVSAEGHCVRVTGKIVWRSQTTSVSATGHCD